MMSRKAMLRGFSNAEGGRAALPFVSMFHGTPSKYLWEDDPGNVQKTTGWCVAAHCRDIRSYSCCCGEHPCCHTQRLNVLCTLWAIQTTRHGPPTLLDRTSLLEDVQTSWLLWVHGALARGNYMTRPGATRISVQRTIKTSFCATIVRHPTGDDQVPVRTDGRSSIACFPHVTFVQVRRVCVSCAPPPPPLAPLPLFVFVRLLVGPSTRRLWPPPVGLCGFRCWVAGARVCREAGGRVTLNVTWTCLRGVHRIRGDLKWSRTGCLCSMGLNSRLTPPWCLL